eukprot:g19140.t1
MQYRLMLMATVGAAVKEDCDFNKDWIALLHVTDANPLPPNWQAFVPAGAAPTVETIAKVDALRTSKRNRNFDLTQCVMADVTNAAAYIVRVILQIRSAASACPEPKACAINIMNIISSFAWISQFTALAVSDCWTKGRRGLLVEVPESPAARPTWRWKAVGSAIVLALVGCAAFAYKTMPAEEPAWTSSVMQTINDWEEIPGIDKTIAKVDALRTSKRNRNFDLTQCVMADVTNAASYIVRVILQIRSAASACPEPKACAINIMNIISSFAWISQFTALAVSDCWTKGDWADLISGSLFGSQKALCAADISDMVAAVTNGPAAGIATTSDCADMPDPVEEEKHLPMD